MKKIALFTWFNLGDNFGQTLQAYALQIFLKSKKYDCKIVNYVNVGRFKKFGILGEKTGVFLLELFFLLKNKKKHIVFKKFIRQNLEYTRRFTNKVKIEKYLKNNKYEILMSGSDQIWNPAILDSVYFLDFEKSDMIKIAYSSSFTNKNGYKKFCSKRIKEDLKEYLGDIDFISSRENIGVNLLKEISGKNINKVLDPVFLLKKQQWEKLPSNSINVNEPYILCYFFSEEDCRYYIDFIKNTYMICKAVYINKINPKYISNDDIILENLNPGDFVELIKNSDVVLTDSFHACAFSIIFHKEFFVLKNQLLRCDDDFAFPERVTELLDELKINRYLEDKVLNEYKKIDYENVDVILKENIEKSKEFLLDSLG